jgi:lysozyme family protein
MSGGVMQGSDILERAQSHLGERYILGAHAPLSNKTWSGPWDCAEYASWLAYQTYGIVYGCGTTGLSGADPYSGFWADDARKRGRKVSAAVAAATPGAFLVRLPITQPIKRIGHVAISMGNGSVYEAASAKLGVRVGPIEGRRWDMGVLLPGVDYDNRIDEGTELAQDEADELTSPSVLILRQQESPTFDDHVVEVQAALKDRGFDPGKIDGLFGPITEAAVYSYQLAEGLLPDGEVGPLTGGALGLSYWPDAGGAMASGTGAANVGRSDRPDIILLNGDAFGAVVDTSTSFAEIQAEYPRLFQSCVVNSNGEILELARRISANRDRYERLVAGFRGHSNRGTPWFFIALLHAMEASGDVGRFKTHLHNGDPLTRPTTHVPKNRPSSSGSNFTWEESARDALALEGFASESDWSLPRMLYMLERFNGMGPRKRGHATAYLWSYSNHYIKGKFISDHVWDDEAVSKQPGAAAILKQLVSDGAISIP